MKTFSKFLCIFTIFVIFVTLVQAQTTQVSYSGTLDSEVCENQLIDLTFRIGYLPTNCTIYIETDLKQDGNTPIYDFGELNNNIIFQRIDKSKNTIIITDYTNDFDVNIHGLTPFVKQMQNSPHLNTFKFVEGPYNYYKIEIQSNDGNKLNIEGVPLYKFNVDSEEFKNLINNKNKIKNDDDRQFADDLYNKGLMNELENFIELKQNENSDVKRDAYYDYFLKIVIVSIIFLIGFGLSYYIYKPTVVEE